MSVEQNISFVHRFFDVIDQANWDELRDMMEPSHLFHFPLAPKPLDREGHIQMNREFRRAFTGFRHEILDMIAAGDKVVTRGIARFTHTGEFQNIPATGKEITLRFINIMRVSNGKNAEEWDEIDSLGMMQQLGVMPQPGNLGPVEALLLGVVRKQGRASAREVLNHVGPGRKIAYTGVNSALTRLYKKGLLTREAKKGRGGKKYIYFLAKNQELQRRIVDSFLTKLVNAFGPAVIASITERLDEFKTASAKKSAGF